MLIRSCKICVCDSYERSESYYDHHSAYILLTLSTVAIEYIWIFAVFEDAIEFELSRTDGIHMIEILYLNMIS